MAIRGEVNVEEFWGECARLRPDLISMAGRCGSTVDAEDIVHEAFLRAAGKRELDVHRLASVLGSVVKRLCVDDRRQRTVATWHPWLLPSQAVDPVETAVDRDEARWLLDRCCRLSDRECFVLLGLERGMPHEEIARRLGTTRRATECIASRARLRVRDQLASRVRAARRPGH